jgi:hypothetical protein
VKKTEDQMGVAVVWALADLETSTVVDHVVVETLTETNARLARHQEERSKEVKEVNIFLKRNALKEEGRDPSHILWKITVGLVATRLQRDTPYLQFPQKRHTRFAISSKMGTNVRQKN